MYTKAVIVLDLIGQDNSIVKGVIDVQSISMLAEGRRVDEEATVALQKEENERITKEMDAIKAEHESLQREENEKAKAEGREPVKVNPPRHVTPNKIQPVMVTSGTSIYLHGVLNFAQRTELPLHEVVALIEEAEKKLDSQCDIPTEPGDNYALDVLSIALAERPEHEILSSGDYDRIHKYLAREIANHKDKLGK